MAKTLEQSIFDFGEATNKDSKRALQIYHDMLLQKEDPIKMNAILLGQFRLLLQVSYLKKAGYQEPEIQKTLAVHPYRVKLALNQCRRYGTPLLEAAFQPISRNRVRIEDERRHQRNAIGMVHPPILWFKERYN